MVKLLFYILPFLVVFLPSLWVKYVLRKFNVSFSDMPFTGKELGKIILEEQNVTNVSINSIKQLDHYNPIDKKIHISEDFLDFSTENKKFRRYCILSLFGQ